MAKPLSREFLLNRGFCCNNGCLNCPYKTKNETNMSKDFNLIPIAGSKNRVYVEIPEKKEKVSAGGIILAEIQEKKPTEGTVLAVSEADENGNKPNVKAGDYVFFSEFAGIESEFDGRKFLVMKESDIHSKLKN